MPDETTQPTLPPAAAPAGQSPVFSAYQTRLLARSNSGLLARSRSKSTDLSGVLASPPASPRKLGGSAAALALSGAKVGRGDLGESLKGHARSAKSVDLVRGQWEQRVAETNGDTAGLTPMNTGGSSPHVTGRRALWEHSAGNEPASPVTASPTHRRHRSALRTSLLPNAPSSAASPSSIKPSIGLGKPPRATTAAVKEDPLQEIARQVSNSQSKRYPSTSEFPLAKEPSAAMTSHPTGSSVAASEASLISSTAPETPKYKSSYMAQRAAKRASASAGLAAQATGESDAGSITPRSTRIRPSSTVGPSRSVPEDTSQLSTEERLAIARANALKRLEAKQQAGNTSVTAATAAAATAAAPAFESEAAKAPTSLANVFTPPQPGTPRNPEAPAPTMSSTYRSIVTPPSAPALTNMFTNPSDTSGKYGSISRADNRKLGRHLPRIASGDGYDEEPAKEAQLPVKSETLSLPTVSSPRSSGLSTRPPAPNVPASHLPSTPSGLRPGRFAATARLPASAPRLASKDAFDTPEKVAPNFTGGSTPTYAKRRSVTSGLGTQKIELDGEGMRGLMSAVGSGAARGAEVDDEEAVVGVKGRLRLSRLPLPASSAVMAPAPLPSRRLMQNTNWMDRQRHALAAYEYLCHVGEAQQWIEGCLDEELGFGVTEMEEGLRDGVVLARLAKVYEGDAVKIWTEAKHRFRQSDNINYFLTFVRNAGLPETFVFELTDLYDKKNIPKVIYCVHVLSHLLARQGRADRISNLVGQFEFTDEQLAATQKGLQGVAMPNFGSVGNALAKDMKWAEEEEVETEDERRDRELLVCQASIIDLQSHLRGQLSRMRASRVYSQLDLAQPIITRFQARARGCMTRRALVKERDARSELNDWAAALQAAARSGSAQKRWQSRLVAVQSMTATAVAMQAHARGRMQRDSCKRHAVQLRAQVGVSTCLQAAARGKLARDRAHNRSKILAEPSISQPVAHLQALLRGRLQRQAIAQQTQVIMAHQAVYTNLQSHIRGAMARRGRRRREQTLGDASDVIVSIQAAARGTLARRRHQAMAKALKQTTSGVTTFQAAARARLAKQNHKGMQKALAKVELAGTVGGLQAFLRTRLAKKSTTEQKKQLEFLAPDVIGFQAAARGCLQRREYAEWRDYLLEPHTQGALIFLQSLIRGFLARRRLWLRTSYLHSNVQSIIKIQALQRGRVQRRLYERLITGTDVDVPTIQNFMHLLDDTEGDFREQVAIDTLRTQTVDIIKENQRLEADVSDLDKKIALVLNNKFTFEDLVRAKRRTGAGGMDNGDAVFHVASSDPFSGSSHLDRVTSRKLELYQYLFFTLQTRPEYLAKLMSLLPVGRADETERRVVESCTLSLFGFVHTQAKREAFLFHKLLQAAVHQEILASSTLDVLLDARYALTAVTTQYLRPAMSKVLQAVLQEHIVRVVEADRLDLCTDPVQIYHRQINDQETATGVAIPEEAKPRGFDADQVLQSDPEARAEYINHLQDLRALTDFILQSLISSTEALPYSIRLLARESMLALRVKFPHAADVELTPVVAKTVVLPFLIPAIVAPETYDLVDDTLDLVQRKNLKEIARLLTFVFIQDYALDSDRFVRVPLKAYLDEVHDSVCRWILELAEVEHPEGHFQANEVIEASREARPISVTRAEIYGMFGVLKSRVQILTASKDDSFIAAIQEIEGAPLEFDKSSAVQLRLSNRLARLPMTAEQDASKADWIQAKRHVLTVLRVQTGASLFEVLITKPSNEHEAYWVELVRRDIAFDALRHAQHPSTAEQSGEYMIDSIRSLPFHEVKSRAIEFCVRLEKTGRLRRDDQFQGLLTSIAADIREKHFYRKSRSQQLRSMQEAFASTAGKKKKLQEQVDSYHSYIDSAMASLQKGSKKRTVLPFSKQFFHQRELAKSGRRAKFGSYRYTAADLYEKGVLLSVNQFSPRQFDKIFVVISSNEIGVFTIELSHPASSSHPIIGSEELRMEDLLTAQFEDNSALQLFSGMVSVNLNTLIFLINRKFYA